MHDRAEITSTIHKTYITEYWGQTEFLVVREQSSTIVNTWSDTH